eukprot:5035385-Prymnesium_polylepis.3
MSGEAGPCVFGRFGRGRWAVSTVVTIPLQSFRVHFYTFRPPASPVRTGTADAERRAGVGYT